MIKLLTNQNLFISSSNKQRKKQTVMKNFTLKFGKYKGQEFLSTPKSYQDWLLSQDWFKKPNTTQARYDVVKKFVTEYAIGMGKRYERVMFNLSWEEAEAQKEIMNLYHLDDCTEFFFTEYSK